MKNKDKFKDIFGCEHTKHIEADDPWWDATYEKPKVECTPKAIGERIRNALSYADISQNELADKVGVTPATISRWMSGQRTPDANDIKRLCTALKCSLPITYFVLQARCTKKH